jgi:hypothetical protein
MKKLIALSFVLVLVSSCAAGIYRDRYGTRVVAAPEFYGTVTYFDPVARRIDLDYIEGGRHLVRNVYYDDGYTRWNGVRYDQIRTGDRIVVRGRQDRDRWRAEEVRRR